MFSIILFEVDLMWKKKVYVYIRKELKYKENIFEEEEIAEGNFWIG